MKILDDLKAIKKLDQSSVLESTGFLPDQIEQAWQEIFELKIPLKRLRKVKNILVAGMGGSGLGARIIDSLNFEVLGLPLEIINGYHLPAYTDKNSLVIISSYSGNTEETLNCYREAVKKKAKLFLISTGGELKRLAQTGKHPAYIFEPTYNPSGQPRLGLGYSISSQLALLARLGFIRLAEAQIGETVKHLKELRKKFVPSAKASQNDPKKIAGLLQGKLPVFVSSEHLEGSAHAFKNFLNENSKTFSVEFGLPELNHHLLEGLAFPQENKNLLKMVFLESTLYDPEIKARFKITKKVVEKNKIESISIEMVGRTRLIQVFDSLYLGGFVSGYLAILNGLDPAPIPWVDFFKKELAAHETKKKS